MATTLGFNNAKVNNKNISPQINLKDDNNFFEWFRGFVDAEGYFTIIKNRNSFSFVFGIGLHIDDLNVLHYIQETLQMGKVYTSTKKAELLVRRSDEIQKIISIFSDVPLNSNKQLNFLAFKKGFELYTQDLKKDEEYMARIEEIRSSMNNNRVDFVWTNREFNITPSWLLGFVEGDGSFSINTTKMKENIFLRFKFIISQTVTDLDLLVAIKNYINSLAASTKKEAVDKLFLSGEGKYEVIPNFVSLYLTKPDKKILNGKGKYNLTVQDSGFIKQILLPFFDRFIFRTKKGLDYVDFKNIIFLKDNGFHYTADGLNLIKKIIEQMNNNRLSTKFNHTTEDRELLLNKINDMLLKPSNFEIREGGKIYIKSLNKYYYNNTVTLSLQMQDESGSVVKTWSSLTSCAWSLKISKSGIQKRIKNATRFVFEGKTVYLKIVN